MSKKKYLKNCKIGDTLYGLKIKRVIFKTICFPIDDHELIENKIVSISNKPLYAHEVEDFYTIGLDNDLQLEFIDFHQKSHLHMTEDKEAIMFFTSDKARKQYIKDNYKTLKTNLEKLSEDFTKATILINSLLDEQDNQFT